MSSDTTPTTFDDEAAQFWESHYSKQSDGEHFAVSPLLVETVTPLPDPALGTWALDLACGRGDDTIWLAERGWHVVAADISPTAINRIVRRAATAGMEERVRAEVHDLARTFPEGSFELISVQHFHTPFEVDRTAILRTAAHALRPGGRLLVVDHGSAAPWSWNQDPDAYFPAPEEIYEELALDPGEWIPLRMDRPQRIASGPNGQSATVADHVLVVRRLGQADDRREA